MELTRRKFGMVLLGSALALLTGAWRTGATAVRAGWQAALRGVRFPGKLRPLDEKDVRSQAKWSG